MNFFFKKPAVEPPPPPPMSLGSLIGMPDAQSGKALSGAAAIAIFVLILSSSRARKGLFTHEDTFNFHKMSYSEEILKSVVKKHDNKRKFFLTRNTIFTKYVFVAMDEKFAVTGF